jgi:membrane associated rhomboid family serine protease
MTAQETSVLVGALIGLMGALQAWLAYRSVAHDKALNGLMAPRIAQGAAAVVVAKQAQQAAQPAADTAAAREAHIAALQAELAALNKLPVS